MDPKPTYEDLEQRVKELEAELVETNRHQDRIRDAEGVLALLRMSPYGIFIIDLSGKVLFANEMGAERLGTTVKEIIGTTLRDYFPPDIAENRRLRGIEAVRSGRRQQFEDQVGDRWYHSAICPIRDEAGRPTSLAIYSADITDRKRLEEALREREEQFRQVTETIREVFWLGSMDWARIYYISPAYEHVWGRSCEEVYERPMSWLDSVLEEDRETITASIPEVMTKDVQEIVFPDYRIRRPDGSVAWISARAFPVLDSSGRPYRIAGIAEDVSDRKRAEEALRESEAQLKSTFLAAPVGICIMKNRVYERANVFWCERFGYPEKDILGRTTRMLYESEEEYERVGRELYANLLEQGLSSTETRLRRSDGVYRDVTVTAAPLHSDDLTAGTVVVVHDVTERMRAEKALRESEERFRRLAEYSPFGLSIMNRDETFEYFNIKFTEIFGYEAEDLPDKKTWFAKAYPDAPYRDSVIDTWRKDTTNVESGGINERVFTVRCKDGGDKVIHFRNIGTEDGKQYMTYEDITEKKKMEQQLQQAQKMEAIGTLAGGIAHDFNNLLMGIQGRASLMLAGMEASSPHFEHLQGIEEYIRSATALTRQLLGFARGGKYEVKVTDVNELADRSLDLFGRTRKEIVIQRMFQKDLWTVEVDRRQMEQVLLNLFVNAWQAMPGGGNLYLQTQNVALNETYVKPHGLKSGNYVKISVTDTGVGMGEKTKQRLFDPFFTTKGMGRGTGLGLASAYGIIKNHDGTITVYSEKGHGSTFNIYLPASGKAVPEEKEKSDDLAKGEGTILLVDDEEVILEVGRPLLEMLGYEVLVAGRGEEAVEVYRENMDRIRAVILDMIMPHMSGGETFDRLKAINPEVKVLLSSGYSINGQAQEILSRGCRGFIQKPFNLKELSQRLREILAGG